MPRCVIETICCRVRSRYLSLVAVHKVPQYGTSHKVHFHTKFVLKHSLSVQCEVPTAPKYPVSNIVSITQLEFSITVFAIT